MKVSRTSVFACLLSLAIFCVSTLHAQTVTMGSPLTATPNISIGCNAYPFPDTSGNFNLFQSNVNDCTWRQSGVFGVFSGDPRFSSVPGDGRITSFSVRSGPNPAPIRLVVFRQLSTPGFGDYSQCCFFVSETNEVQPTPNAISSFTVNIPVQRNVINGFLAVDLIGISARSGAGTLPLAAVGSNNLFNQYTVGSVNAGFFYPRIGTIGNDSGGGRREEGMPGVEVLLQWTWTGVQFGGPTIATSSSIVNAGKAQINLLCNGSATCQGLLELLAFGTTNARAKTPRYGKKQFTISGGQSALLKVKLNKKGKRLVKKNGSLQVTVRMTPADGSAPTNGTMTLTKPL
jgi:hypothetical protein